MNFNTQQNQGVPPNLQYQVPLQQPFMVGSSNIAPNMNQHPSQLMMMGGVNHGFNNSYPYPPPVVDPQQNMDSTPEIVKDNVSVKAGFQPPLVNSAPVGFTNVQNQPINNLNNVQGRFGFHPPMMTQPNIITAPPSVIPQPKMPSMMPNPPMMSHPIVNPPMINPQLINNSKNPLLNNNPPPPPMMNFPMKPLIDTLLNPVVVTVPQRDDTPKLANVVYVGGLTTDTTNEFIINMLQRCGKTSHFKRHTDPSSGLLATFAFCDFESPGGAYYAIECMNNLNYGDNVLRVSCNSRVKCQIDDWKIGKIAEMRHTNPDKSNEQVLQMFEDYKVKLRTEFMELISMHFKTLSVEMEAKKDQNQEDVEQEEPTVETPKSTPKEAKEKPKEEVPVVSKNYVVHRKEEARLHKLKQKRKNYDRKYRDQLSDWEYEEGKMFKRLKSLQTVSASKRERLIQEDLAGVSKPNLRHRAREIEEDYKDAQLELDENKAKKISMKIMAPSSQNAVSDTSKKSRSSEDHSERSKRHKADGDSSSGRVRVVSLFANEAEEVKKPTLTEKEIWKMVPTDDILDFKIDWDLLFSTNLSILIEPWIRRCILEYMGDEESLVNDVLEFIFTRLKERPNPQELLFDVEQFLDEESQGFITQLWRLLAFHQIRLKNQ